MAYASITVDCNLATLKFISMHFYVYIFIPHIPHVFQKMKFLSYIPSPFFGLHTVYHSFLAYRSFDFISDYKDYTGLRQKCSWGFYRWLLMNFVS